MARRPVDTLEEDFRGKAYDGRIVSRLLVYIRPYWWLVLAAVIIMASTSLVALGRPWIISRIVDEGIAKGRPTFLFQMVIVYLGLNAYNALAVAGRINIMAWVGTRVITTLRNDAFARLQALSLDFHSEHEVGRLMSRLTTDVNRLRETVSWSVIFLINDFVILTGTIAIMFRMNARLSLIAFAVIPIMAVATILWRKRAREAYRLARRALAMVNADLAENINGVRVVQSFARERFNYDRFANELNEEHWQDNMRSVRLSAIFFPGVDLLGMIATGLVIWFGGTLVLREQLSAGTLVAFTMYIGNFFGPIRDLASRYNQFQSSMASGERVFDLLDTEPSLTDAPDAIELPEIEGHVTFDNVTFGYTPETMVLKSVDIQVEPGQMVAFVGQTGAGKSSMIKLISRYYDVDQGAILIDGHDLREITTASLHQQIGTVFQETFLFSGTVMDNIRYGRLDATEKEVIAAAKAVGAHAFISELGEGYDTEIREGGSLLSSGQRQMLSFARALLADPRILILDEATSSVDTQTERMIQDAMERLLENRTSFVIAHRLSTITKADQILVMDHGEVIERGTHQELLALRGAYYRLYSLSYTTPIDEAPDSEPESAPPESASLEERA